SNASSIEFLSPNGPLRNDVYDMDFAEGELWVCYGETNFSYNPYPLRKRGISHLSNKYWTNFPYEALPEDRSIISVSINPQDPKQVFFCSYHDGLLEINDDQITDFYTPLNSNLNPTDNPSEAPNAVRLGPAAFDKEGNLWMGNALSEDGLIKFPSGGSANSFKQFDITDILNNTSTNNGFGAIAIDNENNVYMGTYKDGVIGYNPTSQTW